MENITVKIFCPRCGTKHEVGVELETLDNGSSCFYDSNNTCGVCKSRLSVYVSEEADYLSVISIDFGDNPYKFVKENHI